MFAVGVGVGLLIAPMTGRELRDPHPAADRRAAGHAATWPSGCATSCRTRPAPGTCPQPDVEVIGGTAILRGEVPHEVGRTDLERTAAAVAGVVHVENQVDVSGTNGHH